MAEKEKRIFLMRHGDTGQIGRYIGSTDIGLSDKGSRQLAEIAPFISKKSFDLVLVSPLRRCLQSLEILGLEGEKEPLLQEVDFGHWEGKSFAEIAKEYPGHIKQWANDKDFTFPGGESLPAFRSRIKKVAARLYDENAATIFLMAHGGVLRALICELLRLPVENYLLFDVAPGLLTEIALYAEGGVLKSFNSVGNSIGLQ